MKHMQKLTKAEEEIMHVLWELEQAFVKEIIAKMPDPKPKYSTVATVMRILTDKGFTSYEQFGNTYRYYPLVTKDAYSRATVKTVMSKYFDGSFRKMVSFFVSKEELDTKELDDLMQLLENERKKKDSDD